MELDHYTDQEIAQAILRRDTFITKEYLYKKCYPLFKALFDNYETDCVNVKEFIHEMYAFLLTPGRNSHICPLATFRAEGSLLSWLKLVGRTYCCARFRKKKKLKVELIDINDIYGSFQPSLNFDMSAINRMDVERLLQLMPNKRYSQLIKLRYMLSYSNELAAQALGMSMANYYNKHKLAKEQFVRIYNKEFRK